MQSPTRISFIRHGHVHNPDNIYYGRLPNFRLSKEGEEQARLAGVAMRPYSISAIYSSPMLRAQQTAALIQEQLPAAPPIQTTEELIEVHTPHDGISRLELETRNWDLYTGSSPEYEQPADVLKRVRAFIQTCRTNHVGDHVIAVTHGDIIAFTIIWAIGHVPDATRKVDLLKPFIPDEYPQTASISTLTFTTTAVDEQPKFEYYNPHAHQLLK